MTYCSISAGDVMFAKEFRLVRSAIERLISRDQHARVILWMKRVHFRGIIAEGGLEIGQPLSRSSVRRRRRVRSRFGLHRKACVTKQRPISRRADDSLCLERCLSELRSAQLECLHDASRSDRSTRIESVLRCASVLLGGGVDVLSWSPSTQQVLSASRVMATAELGPNRTTNGLFFERISCGFVSPCL